MAGVANMFCKTLNIRIFNSENIGLHLKSFLVTGLQYPGLLDMRHLYVDEIKKKKYKLPKTEYYIQYHTM